MMAGTPEKLKQIQALLRTKYFALVEYLKHSPVFHLFLKTTKITFWGILAIILNGLIVGAGIFYFMPAAKWESRVRSHAQNFLEADKIGYDKIDWKHSLRDFSLGLTLVGFNSESSNWLSSIRTSQLIVTFQPIEWLRGRNPVSVVLDKANIVLDPKKPFRVGPHLAFANLKIRDSAVNIPESEILAKHLNFSILSSAAPGSLRVELQTELEGETKEKSWIVAGEFKASGTAYFVRDASRTVGMNFDDFVLDLSNANLQGLNLFEKLSQIPLRIQMKPKVVFSDERVSRIEFGQGRCLYDNISLDFQGSYETTKAFDLEWIMGRTEIKDLRLPFRYLRMAPGKGILSTSGRLHLTGKPDTSEASWRFVLNNFTMDAKDLANYSGDADAAWGPVRLSVVSEGDFALGRVHSPKTEVQIDATEMQLALFDGQFVKPKGDATQAMFRLSLDDDTWFIKDFKIDVHTLKVEGDATINVSKDLPYLTANLRSNKIALSDWSSYFSWFRKLPLQGFFQMSSKVEGNVNINTDKAWWESLKWQIDRIYMSNVMGSFQGHDRIQGPFGANLFFNGRGVGAKVSQATLQAKLDLTQSSLRIGENFRKPENIPMEIDFATDISRNQLDVKRGSMRMHDLELDFRGRLIRGSRRSKLEVRMQRPLDLSGWRIFTTDVSRQSQPSGSFMWKGFLSFPTAEGFEGDLDFSDLRLDGEMNLANLRPHFGSSGGWGSSDISDLNGKMIFSEDQISTPQLRFVAFGIPGTFSGSIEPKSRQGKKLQLSLKDWMKLENMKVAGSLDLKRIDWSALMDRMDSRDKWRLPKKFTDGKFFRTSDLSVALNIDELWNAGKKIGDMMGLLTSDGSAFNLRPLSLAKKSGSGGLSGSALLDMKPYQDRRDAPELRVTFNLKDSSQDLVNIFLPATGLEAKTLSGTLQASSFGFTAYDLEKNMKLLLKGQSSNAINPFLAEMNTKWSQFLRKSKAVDYLLNHANLSACEQTSSSKSNFELSMQDAHTQLEKARWENATTKARMDFTGSLKDGGNALWVPPSRCFKPLAQQCFAAQKNYTAPGLKIAIKSEGAGVWSSDFDPEAFGASMADCIAKKIAASAAAAKKTAAVPSGTSESKAQN